MKEKVFKPGTQGEKFNMLMFMHFPGVMPKDEEKLCCEICQDFQQKYCSGKNLKGMAVLGCMLEQANKCEIEVSAGMIESEFIQ